VLHIFLERLYIALAPYFSLKGKFGFGKGGGHAYLYAFFVVHGYLSKVRTCSRLDSCLLCCRCMLSQLLA
jgi:hypothetical protein